MTDNNHTPAGLGTTVHILPPDGYDGEKLDGIRIDLSKTPKPSPDDKHKGWTVTGNVDLCISEEERQAWRRYFRGKGRLPRRRKKQLLRRVLESKEAVGIITGVMLVLPPLAYNYCAERMFPDRSLPLVRNKAEDRLVHLCMNRAMRLMRGEVAKAIKRFGMDKAESE